MTKWQWTAIRRIQPLSANQQRHVGITGKETKCHEQPNEKRLAMRCVEVLMEEHKTILRALDVLQAMALMSDAGQTVNRDDIQCIIEFLRTFADDRHQGKEECELFPVLRSAGARAEIDSVRHMIFEHNQERSLVGGLEDAMLAGNNRNFAEYAERLIGILRTHIYKEDHILFEAVSNILTNAEDERITAGFKALDSSVPPELCDSLLRQLRRLERKYMAKAETA
jgi:hemerythrin-like domain-containing protein